MFILKLIFFREAGSSNFAGGIMWSIHNFSVLLEKTIKIKVAKIAFDPPYYTPYRKIYFFLNKKLIFLRNRYISNSIMMNWDGLKLFERQRENLLFDKK